MSQVDLQLVGMQELLQEIERIGRQVDGPLMSKALLEGAELIKNEAKDAARIRTGNLKANIIVSDEKNGVVDIGPNQQGDAFYGYFVEFGRIAGTRRYGANKGHSYPGMSPKPFMGPTYERTKELVQEKMADVIKRELNL